MNKDEIMSMLEAKMKKVADEQRVINELEEKLALLENEEYKKRLKRKSNC